MQEVTEEDQREMEECHRIADAFLQSVDGIPLYQLVAVGAIILVDAMRQAPDTERDELFKHVCQMIETEMSTKQ